MSVLEVIETNIDRQHNDINWRHSGWKNRRRKVLSAISATNQLARYSRISSCGDRAYVYKHQETGEVRIKASHCHDKQCLPCATARGQVVSENIKCKLIESHKTTNFYHVVLTLTHNDKPLAEQLDTLNKHWSKLRNGKAFKQVVCGGFAAIEVTRNRRNQWHPHLHLIVDAPRPLEADLIRTLWHQLTTAEQVDVSIIEDNETAAFIISRYVSKPISSTVYNDDAALEEYVVATAGRRSIATFGSWRGISLTKADRQPINETDWQCLGSLAHVVINGLWKPELKHVARQLEVMRTVLARPPSPPVKLPAGW